jgi:hypothetical protein
MVDAMIILIEIIISEPDLTLSDPALDRILSVLGVNP